MKLKFLFLSMLTGLIIDLPSALAHQGATGVVKERMNLMKDIKEDMKYIKKAVSKKDPENTAKLRKMVRSLKSRSDEILPLFPEGSLQHPSEALSEIWKDWPRFRKLTIELGTGLDELEKLLRDGQQTSYKPALKKISQTCSGCHDKFREEKR
jgi:cytochrome c556